MIGYRGCYRYVRNPENRARPRRHRPGAEETPNLHLMIPFVRTPWEVEACLGAIDGHALGRQRASTAG